MGRAKTILQSHFPYNIGARCINKEWFNLPLETVWEIFCEELAKTSEEQSLNIHSFVLMSNHFHLIASTPEANISQCMHQFMSRSSRRLTRAGNRINETFAGRHYKCILQHPNYYLNAYKYNYRNPVSAGISQRVEEYKFSTLAAKLKITKPLLPLIEDTTLFSDIKGTLDWLNTSPPPEKLEAVKMELRRQFFSSKRYRNSNLPIVSENDTL